MTRSKIQKIKIILFFLIFFLPQIAVSDINFRGKRQEDTKKNDLTIHLKSNNGKPLEKTLSTSGSENKELNAQVSNTNSLEILKKNSIITSKTAIGNATTVDPLLTTSQVNLTRVPSINSGALIRGIFVIIGLSVLIIAYRIFRSCRLNKTHTQMVRKYGVLAHRQDVEMRPLPLDEEDDDDTTVFDASNISSNRSQEI